jgi:ABC-type phosphate/phosphonate transport system substrate-binding protein
MKLPKYFIFFFLNFLFANDAVLFAQVSNEKEFRIILSSSMLQNSKPEDVAATTRILANEMNKERKDRLEFKILVSNEQDELSNYLKTPFDLTFVSPIEYLQLKKKISIEPALVTETNKSYGDVYYLITNKKDNIKELSELKDGIIFILANSNEQVSSLWLDKILRENKLPVKSKFFKKINYDNKATNVVLPVFFKKANASIVTEAAFDLLCELNPSIKKEASILKISEPYIRAIFCFDGRSKDEERKKFLSDYIANLHLGAYGKQLTELYMINRLVPFKESYLENIIELLKK